MDNISPDVLSTTKQALLTIRELKQRLAECERGPVGDIAIVSMACRFPRRSDSPEAFWNSLIEGRDEISEIPADRWELAAFYDENPEAVGKMYARHGVFLERLDLMDPEFFGISPREATWVDPQQRLLLETSWEALERAGWTPGKIGATTGVFVGWMHNDYQNEAGDSFLNLNPYIATGAAGSFLPGRLAYHLGLEGPSVAVDTACSSSLVALHLACQSVLTGDCERAIVGGVNAIVSPTTNILTCKLKALSPRGHSRAFDAEADGYLRGEGCGVIAIRRLADAERDGDPILGVIRGTAVGHNGHSSGLTVPNPRAQERVIRRALERARVTPELVRYLEAHGTGTELGDPIELQAAAAAYATKRNRENALLVGSVKTNIGHLEAAAGMAGLIKTILSFEHNQIAPQINFETPNPHIAWDQLPVKVVTEPTPWPANERRLAGVSAFGMSGTNAHVILEAPPRSRSNSASTNGRPRTTTIVPSTRETSPQLLVVSGKTEEALYESIARFRKYLEKTDATLADIAWTAGIGRSHFDHRAAIIADDNHAAAQLLEKLERGSSDPAAVLGQHRTPPKIALQFTGQGSQYLGMARQLYQSEPVFRSAIDECEQWLKQDREELLTTVLFEKEDLLNHTSWTQPAIFAVQMGLVKLLEQWGMIPDVVMGHSVGQYAAACTAGVMSWEDGIRLISERGRLIGNLPAGGGMLAVFAPRERIEEAIQSFPAISLAAFNGTHIVVSGPLDDLARLKDTLADQSIRSRQLQTSHAFHSALMDPVLGEFSSFANRFSFEPPQLPLVCNVTGEVLGPDARLDGGYWGRHIRAAVQYAESIDAVQELGCDIVLEIGPQAILTNMARANWRGEPTALFSALSREDEDQRSLLKCVGQLYVRGVAPDFEKLHGNAERERVVLPTYPFQRRRFWGPAKPRTAYAHIHTAHPLLGEKCQLAGLPNQTRYESFVEPDSPAWLPDHRVMDQSVLPGAALIEMALAITNGASLREIHFEQPLQPPSRTQVQTILTMDQERGGGQVEIYSSPDESPQWTRHLRVSVGEPANPPEDRLDLQTIENAFENTMEPAQFYEQMRELGLHYGPQFQTIQSLRFSDSAVLAKLSAQGDYPGYRIAPPLLDGALHSLAVGILASGEDSLFLPIGMDAFEWYAETDGELWCHGQWNETEGQVRSANIVLYDSEGRPVARVRNLKVRQINPDLVRQMNKSFRKQLAHELRWQPYRLPGTSDRKCQWLVVSPATANTDSLTTQLGESLRSRGHDLIEVTLGSDERDSKQRDWPVYSLDDPGPEAWSQIWREAERTIPGYRPAGVIWMPGKVSSVTESLDGLNQLQAISERNIAAFLPLLKALQHAGIRQLDGGFQWITTNAVAVAGPDETAAPHVEVSQSPFWGLGRVLAAEFPEYRSRLIDLDQAPADLADDDLQTLVDVLCNDTGEGQVAIRDGRYLVPRLEVVDKPNTSSPSLDVNTEASYLITGGLGKLGLEAARWLVSEGAKHLVLVSRREPDEAAQAIINTLKEQGAAIAIRSADLGAAEDVKDLLSQFGSEFPSLKGIIHAAGVLDDGLLIDQSWDRFRKVLAPKITGATLLHQFSQSMPLDFFVLYSSAASVLGSPGQSNYAMGNAYLDGLAAARRSAGLPALSVNWGPWEVGMADDEKVIKRMKLQGITPLPVDTAHETLANLLASRNV
ncbi:MAG: hypothetical protein CMJ46_08255, partial [Planctomyces sp.]|nr:hypothetical protein [Planctomyces sp.]